MNLLTKPGFIPNPIITMKTPATFTLLLLLSQLAFSQAYKKIDSLKELLTKQQVDTARFNTNLMLWRQYLNVKADSAIFYGNEALELARKNSDELSQGKALASIGLAYSMRNEFSIATEYLVDAQKIFDDNPEPFYQAMIFNEYGIIHLLQKQLRDALDPFEKSIEFKLKTGDSIGIAKTYNNIGGVYEQLDLLDSSLMYHFKSLEIKQRMNYKDGVGYSYNNISSIYHKQGKSSESLETANKALAIFEETGNRDGKIYALNMVAENHREREDWDKSIYYHNQALEESRVLNNPRRMQEAYRKLAASYEGKGDFKLALENERLYRVYKDSIDNLRNVRRIEQVKSDYEIEKRETEISKQDAELAQQATFRNALYGGIVLLLAIIGLVVRNQRIKTKSLKEKDALLREIHHRVKNNLQVISSLLNMQSREAESEEMLDAIQEGQSRVKAMALIHQKLYQTENITEIDFQEYAEDLHSQLAVLYKREGLEIENKIDASNLRLDIDTAIPLGLIMNELISNAYKYAFEGVDNGTISIGLSRVDDQRIQLEVSDDGKGLPENFSIDNVASLGLKLVNILTRQLKGTLNFETGPGTKFSILFDDLKLNLSG